MNGLEPIDPPELTVLERVTGKKRRELALVQVQNMIATQPIYQIYHDGIEAVLRSAKLTLADVRPELLELYKRVLAFYTKDGTLTAVDADKVDRLRILMGLGEEHVRALHDAAISKRSQT